MTASRDEGWQDFASKLQRRVAARVVQLSGDHDLVDEIVRDVLVVARASFDDPDATRPSWTWFDDLTTRLTAERTQPPAGLVELAAVAAGPDTAADVELVSTALARVDEDERTALTLHYVNGFDVEQGARFFATDDESFAELLARARARLQAEYRRLVDGLIAVLVVAVDATRRVRRTWARSRVAFTDQVAAKWVRFDPFHAVDAMAASAAANFSFAAVVVVSAAMLSAGATTPPAEASRAAAPAVSARVVTAWASEMATNVSRTATTWAARTAAPVAPTATTPAATPVTTAQPTADTASDESTRHTVAGPVTKTEYPEEGITNYRVEGPPPPAEPAASVPAPVPSDAPAPPPVPATGVEDGPPSLKAGYTCPPPDQRPPPLVVACAVLEPAA